MKWNRPYSCSADSDSDSDVSRRGVIRGRGRGRGRFGRYGGRGSAHEGTERRTQQIEMAYRSNVPGANALDSRALCMCVCVRVRECPEWGSGKRRELTAQYTVPSINILPTNLSNILPFTNNNKYANISLYLLTGAKPQQSQNRFS